MKWFNQSKITRYVPGRVGRLMALIGVLFLVPQYVQAACPIVDNMTSVPTLKTDPSLPVGSVLASTQVMWQASYRGCSVSVGVPTPVIGLGTGTLLDASQHLYATTIPGIAYRAGYGGMWAPYSYGSYTSIVGTWDSGYVTIEFVKTGPVGSGTFGPQTLITESIGGQAFWLLNLATKIDVLPANPACTVTSSAITETLTDVSQATLNAVGKTAGDKTVNIPLNCKSSANISLAFSGTMADVANGVFANTNATTGASVGIQLLDKNGTAVPTTMNNYVPVGTINGSFNYPLTARYYALSSTVPTGNVSAVAFATIVYN